MSSKSNSTASNGSTATAPVAGMAKYEPRMCHVVKRADFDGYGFNLHAEKGRPGQYIGKVDDGSPAEAAGLRQGDRIIEVNGQNITTETHKKVVELIKAVPNETRLLVIDPRADANDLKMALAKAAAGTVGNGAAPNNNNNNNSNGTSNGHHESNGNGTPNGVSKENDQRKDSKEGSAKVEDKHNNNNNNNHHHNHSNGNGTAAPESPMMEKIIDDTKKVLTVTDGAAVGKMALNGTTPATPNGLPATGEQNKTTAPAEGMKLNLSMTAAEMRAKLAARKKYDPKNEVCDLRKKYDIIQKM